MTANATILVSIFAAVTVTAGTSNYLEQFSPRFSVNTKFVWRAPRNALPESFWIYRRSPTRPFSGSIVSNAAVLASIRGETIPKPSKKAFYIWSEPDGCGIQREKFSLQPGSTTINYFGGCRECAESNLLDEAMVKTRAFELATWFGLDAEQLTPTTVFDAAHGGGCDGQWTNCITSRGIYLARKLDGVSFFGDKGNGSEGFTIEFGKAGVINAFSFVWPELSRDFQSQAATPQDIIRCIRFQRILVVPDDDEPNYFARLGSLTNALQFTITRISPRYGEGRFGMVPVSDAPAQSIAPFAEMEGIAMFPATNTIVHFLAPLMVSDVKRLLNTK